MSLPTAWVDKIFTKLTLVYGRDFLSRWEGIAIADVKTDWAHELSGFENWPEGIAHALQHLPSTKTPTVYEFRDLAHKCERAKHIELPSPKADPAIVAMVKQKLSAPVKAVGRLDWATRIIERNEQGAKISPTVLRMAKDALGAE